MDLDAATRSWIEDGFVVLPGYLPATDLAPSTAPAYRQLELFVFLSEVTVELGAPRMVPRSAATDGLPARPNFFPRAGTSDTEAGFVASTGRPDLYREEVPATGP